MQAIHHEVYHMITTKISLKDYKLKWQNCNPQGFHYEQNATKEHGYGLGESADIGFLTGYSRSSVEEDMAEVFAVMMLKYDWSVKRMENDTIIRNKVMLIKQIVVMACEEMDGKFWDHMVKQW